jgi:hypothetical protein
MPMLTSILCREYQSALTLDVAVPLVFVAIFAATGLNDQTGLGIILLLLTYLVPIVAALGFAAGERCFSSTFKETSLFLMSGLPIARSKVWLAIISARLLASLIGLGLSAGFLALVARRANFVTSPTIETYATIFLVFLASYFFGGIWSLLVRRTLAVYGLGLTATEEVFSALRHANPKYIDPFYNISQFDPYFNSRYWLAELCILVVLACSLSAHIFGRFELASTRRRITNFVALLASLLCYSWIALTLATAERNSLPPGMSRPVPAKAFSVLQR